MSQQDYRKDIPSQPVQYINRSCTDIVCCLIFIVLNIVLLSVGIYALSSGFPQKMKVPYDPDYNGCSTTLPDHPYIYFVNPSTDVTINYQYLTYHTCVKQCPVQGQTKIDCYPNSLVKSCQANDSENPQQAVIIYTTEPSDTFHVCIPKDQQVKDRLYRALSIQSSSAKDLERTKWIILSSIFIAMFFGLIYLLLMRYILKWVVWIFIIFFVVMSVLFGSMLIAIGAGMNNQYTQIITQSQAYIKTHGQQDQDSRQSKTKAIEIVIGVFIILIGIGVLILSIFNRRKIDLAIIIMNAVSKFIADVPKVFIVPLCLFIFTVLFFFYWVFITIGLYSIGTVNKQQGSKHLPYAVYQHSNGVFALIIMDVFYLIWSLLFITQIGNSFQLGQFIVQGSAVNWYFFQKKQQEKKPYNDAIKRLFLFHIGSVCLGSCLSIFLALPELILSIIMCNQKNKMCKCCRTVLSVICWPCIKVTDYYSTDAYSLINLTGKNFFKSSSLADKLYQNNSIARVVDGLTTVILYNQIFVLMANLFIAFGTMGICGIIIQYAQPFKSTVVNPFLPIIACGLFGLAVSLFFVQIYGNAADAILTMYIAMQDKGNNTNKSVPKDLIQFIDQAKKYNQDEYKQIQ